MKTVVTDDGWIELVAEDSTIIHEPEYYYRKGSEVVRYKNRVVFRLAEEDGDVLYSKWFYPQKTGLLKKLENGIKRIFRGPRVRHIYAMHNDLLAAGFGCAEPVLAAWRGDDYTELFVSKEICATPVHNIIREDQEARILNILKSVAEDLKRLHQAGFVHGDAIPGNISIDQEGKVFYLDNDRTMHCRSRHQAFRNVIQFCSHLSFYCSLPNAEQYFIENYGVSPSEKSDIVTAVEKRIAEIAKERERRKRQKGTLK